MMKLHFDPNQQYQFDAVKSIIDLFEGQPLNHGDFGFSVDDESRLFQEGGVGNRLLFRAKTNCPFRKRLTACTFPWRWKQAPARPMYISAPFTN